MDDKVIKALGYVFTIVIMSILSVFLKRVKKRKSDIKVLGMSLKTVIMLGYVVIVLNLILIYITLFK